MNKEKLIQEQRTIEAMKNGYMGLEGKFSNIAKKLGYPIISQSSSNFQQTFLEDFYGFDEEPDDFPTMDEDEIFNEIGHSFDGYKFGCNLTINLFFSNMEINVSYNGYVVYKEVAGELERYIPNDEWSKIIDDLYESSIKTDKKMRQKQVEENIVLANRRKKEILEKLKTKWGI